MPYKVTEDIYYTNFLQSQQIAESTKKQYKKILTKFTKATNNTLEHIITDCKNQQNKIIETTNHIRTDESGKEIVEKTITKFNVNNPESKIKMYLNTYINYCKNKNNSNKTINQNLAYLKVFLKYYEITLPKIKSLEDDSQNWYLLEKEDFKFVMADSTLTHASLIKLLQSTGMRIGDATKLTIGDFMEATSEYHNYSDVNEFIDNAPSDMIGTWYFNPSKTQRFNIACLTFNDPETSNLILQNLRRIKNEYIPYIKEKHDIVLTISKNDALFGSEKSNYKGHLLPVSVANKFWFKNKKLREWRISKIDEAITKGELSIEDRDKEISKIPKFHAHACRKYFETIIAKNCGNLRICTLLEGHSSPVSTDSSYIKHDVSDVKEVYMSALEDLSLENTHAKVYTSDARREMESKINDLENKNQELESKLDEYSSFEERLRALEENRPSWNEFVKGD